MKVKVGRYAHLCRDGTIYVWTPIIANPRACPRDKERIDAPHIRRENHADITFCYNPKRHKKYAGTHEFREQLKKLKQ